MGVKKREDALFDGLAEVRLAADHLDGAAREFERFRDGSGRPQTEAEGFGTEVASKALKSLKKLIDVMQIDWTSSAEDRYKEVSMLCFEEMSKLRDPTQALTYAKGAER